jgi:serine/threonine protein kinase
MFKKIKLGKYEFHEQYWSAVSDEAKDFISKLLQIDPAHRFTADQALCHPWVG